MTQCQVTSIQRTIARWESNTDPRTPGDRYQFLLAHLYARTTTGSIAVGPGSDFALLLDAFRCFGIDEPRIAQLVDMISTHNTHEENELLDLLPYATYRRTTAVLSDPFRFDHDLLEQFTTTLAAIHTEVGSAPFVRLQIRLAPIVATCRELLRSDRASSRDELLTVATDALSLSARLAFETRDDSAALSLYREATDIAGRLSHRHHRAKVLTSRAMVTLHATEDLNAARNIARAAVQDAHRSDSYAIRTRAHAVHAETCARVGDRDQAHAALERAWKTVEQLSLDKRTDGFSADSLSGFDGLCALHLGDAQRAHDRLVHSLAALKKPHDAVQRGIVITDLALAHLRLGDPAACASLLHEAVDITSNTGGRVSAQRIRQARHVLRPWRSENFIAKLDDHIHDKLIA